MTYPLPLFCSAYDLEIAIAAFATLAVPFGQKLFQSKEAQKAAGLSFHNDAWVTMTNQRQGTQTSYHQTFFPTQKGKAM